MWYISHLLQGFAVFFSVKEVNISRGDNTNQHSSQMTIICKIKHSGIAVWLTALVLVQASVPTSLVTHKYLSQGAPFSILQYNFVVLFNSTNYFLSCFSTVSISNVYLMEVCMHWNKICMSLPGPLAKSINCRYQKYIFKRLKRTGVRNCTWRIPPSCHPRDIHSMPLFHSIVIFCHKSYNIVNEHINKNLKSFFWKPKHKYCTSYWDSREAVFGFCIHNIAYSVAGTKN